MISKLVYFVFSPALIFSKLAESVTPQRLAAWWPLTVNMAITNASGFALGTLLAKAIRPPPRFKAHVVVACGMGNVRHLDFFVYSCRGA